MVKWSPGCAISFIRRVFLVGRVLRQFHGL